MSPTSACGIERLQGEWLRLICRDWDATWCIGCCENSLNDFHLSQYLIDDAVSCDQPYVKYCKFKYIFGDIFKNFVKENIETFKYLKFVIFVIFLNKGNLENVKYLSPGSGEWDRDLTTI